MNKQFVVVAATVTVLLFSGVARAASKPPDPLFALLGVPTQTDGKHYYYKKTRFGHHFICRIWAYGSTSSISSYVEQCVTAKRKPVAKGPTS